MQIHCTHQDLTGILLDASASEEVFFVLLAGSPPTFKLVHLGELANSVASEAEAGSVRSIFIFKDIPNLPVKSRLDLFDLNPENIVVDVGLLTRDGLKQSVISNNSSEGVLVGLWKKIMKGVKENTHAGVTAINVDTGARKVYKAFRYSDAALELQRSGVAMLPFAGGGKLILGDVA